MKAAWLLLVLLRKGTLRLGFRLRLMGLLLASPCKCSNSLLGVDP